MYTILHLSGEKAVFNPSLIPKFMLILLYCLKRKSLVKHFFHSALLKGFWPLYLYTTGRGTISVFILHGKRSRSYRIMENWCCVKKPLLKANQILAVSLKRTNTYITQTSKIAVSTVSIFFCNCAFLKHPAQNPEREFTSNHD